jgi:hypothetical protein
VGEKIMDAGMHHPLYDYGRLEEQFYVEAFNKTDDAAVPAPGTFAPLPLTRASS